MRIIAIFWITLIALILLYNTDWVSERFFPDAFIFPEDSALYPAERALPTPSDNDSDAGPLKLYQTWEMTVSNQREYKNPFDYEEIALKARFTSPSGKTFDHHGFHDGVDAESQQPAWRIRFMPNEPGTWQYEYRWTDQDSVTRGSFQVSDTAAPGNHGHIKIDPHNPHYLIHEDGTPHYWVGGKWISARDYGPPEKGGEENYGVDSSGAIFGYKTDQQLIDYLDLLYRYKHNGLLMKIGLYPLEKDRLSWDLEWIQRGEWLVREAQKRGIYVQINMFDTWSRKEDVWFTNAMNGSKQPFDVWNTGDEALKKNYLRTIVARFAGYSNIYWELGNEMEHYPNCGECFVKRANAEYIPWIRSFDPYDLPIGLSEEVWLVADVDIGFLHQTDELPNINWNRPVVMNELVGTGYPLSWREEWNNLRDGLWQDEMMRNPDWRYMYRKTFWQNFTFGGCGASEATWLNLYKPINEAAANVMADHWRMHDFIDSLPVSINNTVPDINLITESSFNTSTRSDKQNVFVSYLLAKYETVVEPGVVELNLPEGSFDARWFEPLTGKYGEPVRLAGGKATLPHPAFDEDIVLLITRTPD